MEFYTDGSVGRKKIGFHAYIGVLNDEIVFCGRYKSLNTCNNQEELRAIIKVLKQIKQNSLKDVTIYTDSLYVIRSITGNRKAFLNLWEEFFKYYNEDNVNIVWLKGHNGNIYNQKVDTFARKGIL